MTADRYLFSSGYESVMNTHIDPSHPFPYLADSTGSLFTLDGFNMLMYSS